MMALPRGLERSAAPAWRMRRLAASLLAFLASPATSSGAELSQTGWSDSIVTVSVASDQFLGIAVRPFRWFQASYRHDLLGDRPKAQAGIVEILAGDSLHLSPLGAFPIRLRGGECFVLGRGGIAAWAGLDYATPPVAGFVLSSQLLWVFRDGDRIQGIDEVLGRLEWRATPALVLLAESTIDYPFGRDRRTVDWGFVTRSGRTTLHVYARTWTDALQRFPFNEIRLAADFGF